MLGANCCGDHVGDCLGRAVDMDGHGHGYHGPVADNHFLWFVFLFSNLRCCYYCYCLDYYCAFLFSAIVQSAGVSKLQTTNRPHHRPDACYYYSLR